MSESGEEQARRRRLRWISLGEAIAIAALVISGLGLWREWRKDDAPSTTTVIEKRQAIPLTLRAKAADHGRSLAISAVEPSHALESLTLAVKGGEPIDVGSDGQLDAQQVERALGDVDRDKKGAESVPVRIETRYVEMGKDKTSVGNYRLTYRWEGGGLFGGHSLRLVSLSRG
ncbi:MAG TPA: hypothetical protein VFL74_07155 [Sphingomicrobium sp.]|jgi:hypothetical protein|nr:hypothetical protein [Sphingomicrobium sp.]